MSAGVAEPASMSARPADEGSDHRLSSGPAGTWFKILTNGKACAPHLSSPAAWPCSTARCGWWIGRPASAYGHDRLIGPFVGHRRWGRPHPVVGDLPRAVAGQRSVGTAHRSRRLMTAGILAVAVGFVWLAYGRPGGIYVEAILPVCFCGARARADGDAADCRGAGGVSDADIGEASGISDVASRLGRAVMTALVPVLSWVQAGRSLT
jgi:hypothetical protein